MILWTQEKRRGATVMAMSIYLYVLSGMFIIPSIIRFFKPDFYISEHLRSILDRRGTAKQYFLYRKIIGLVSGGVLVLAGYLPDEQRVVCLPMLGLIFVIILACNKIFIGSFISKK